MNDMKCEHCTENCSSKARNIENYYDPRYEYVIGYCYKYKSTLTKNNMHNKKIKQIIFDID
jgi:hypothetical protein